MAIKVKETKDNIKAKILKEDCPIKCACIKETDTSIKANIQTNLTNATTTNKGIVRLATLEEAITGTDNTIAITPYTLHNVSTYTAGDGINITNKVISVNDDIIATKEFVNEEINLLDNQISLINNTINTYGDIVTYNATDFATKNQGLLADSALQPNDNISELVNNVGYITGITSSDIQTALGYIPYSAENPSGFITVSALNGYATENWVGQQGYLTSSDLSGYATEQWVNNQGFIKGINNTDVITALGYTPYDNSNPAGYITSESLPTVNNSTITIQKNGSDIESFNLNQPTNETINITVPTQTSDLTNNSGFITNTVNNLTNYYLKSETYTKTEVQQLIASIPQFSVVVVQTLPVTGERMVLYLVPKEGASPDVYNEYIWVETDEDYELIGNTAIDLTDYVQFTDLATVATTGDYDDLIDKPIPPIGYGTSSTAGATATKVISIPEITELNVGQVIVVKPSTTSSVANSKIKLNDFEAYNMRYNNANITKSNGSIVWSANVASMFIFDGTYWQFLGHGLDINTNTTYASMSVAEGITGTATATRSLTATNLKQIIQDTKLKGLVTTDDADVVASDSITIGIGKLQAQSTETKSILEDKQNTLNAGTDLEIIRYPVGETTIDGTGSITLDSAKANSLNSVTLYGACSQSSAPTPENPVDITCNNGVIGWDSANNVITVTGTTETVTDSLNNTATAEMLLGLEDKKDSQELLGGNIVRNVGIKVLDGTEAWATLNGGRGYYVSFADTVGIPYSHQSYCTHFRFVSWTTQTTPMGNNCFAYNKNGDSSVTNGNITFKPDLTVYNTVEKFKQFLAEQYSNGTPVIVIYPLETPTTETVTAQTLNTQSGNNTLTITQASLNNLTLSANYEAMGDVINFTGTIGNGTITINQGGTPKGTFTTNQNGNTTIDLDAGGTVDQTFDGTSTNAQSGVAISGELGNFVQKEDVSVWTPRAQDINLGNYNMWCALAYDNTKFVALGNEGYISTSTDGITWTSIIQNPELGENSWQDLAYNDVSFIALGLHGYISTSTDGITWTTAVQDTNLGDNTWKSLVYDGTKFVALGSKGYISTSTNGITWTTAVKSVELGEHVWEFLTYDGTKFVALGQSGYISTSTDGITWTTTVKNTNLGSHTWRALAYDGIKFIALSQFGYISTSTDGITWTEAVRDTNLGSSSWLALTYSGTKFVALGQSGYVSTSSGLTHLLNIQNNLYIDFTNNNKFNLLDGATGLIPDARLSTNIARTSSISNGTITFTQGGVTKGTITTNQSGDTTIDFDAGGGSYTLPIASASTLGGIKVGNNLSIDQDGVLSAITGGGGTVDQTYSPTSANAQSGVAIAGELVNYVPLNSSSDIDIHANSINFDLGDKLTLNSVPVLCKGWNSLSDNVDGFGINIDTDGLWYSWNYNDTLYADGKLSGMYGYEYGSNNTVSHKHGIEVYGNGINFSNLNYVSTITIPSDGLLALNGHNIITDNNLKTINNQSIIGSGNINISGGTTYTAGNGINITNNTISIDTSVVATQTDISDMATQTWVGNQGYLTGITSSDVITALTYIPYNGATNPNGYITSADLPTNYVTTDTAQNISGRKTFLGEKAIYFKQLTTANKLGFTLYNPSNTELGALEYRPNTIGGASLLTLNCPQTTGGYVGFRYWGTPAVNIVAPKVATAGNYFIPTHITDGNTTVTANNTGTVNISTLLPDVSNFVTNSSLATTLQDYVLSSDLSTTLTNYVTSSSLTTVLNDYQPLLVSGTNIKTVNNQSLLGSGNIDIQGGVSMTYDSTTETLTFA